MNIIISNKINELSLFSKAIRELYTFFQQVSSRVGLQILNSSLEFDGVPVLYIDLGVDYKTVATIELAFFPDSNSVKLDIEIRDGGKWNNLLDLIDLIDSYSNPKIGEIRWTK